jgi:hypothetical protein
MLQHVTARREQDGARRNGAAERQEIAFVATGPMKKEDRWRIGRSCGLETVNETEV